MAAKKRAAKAGAGAAAAGQAVRTNQYVQRLMEDDDLRDNLKTAYESARKAYSRMSNGKDPVRSLTEDKKTQKDLREAAISLREASDSLRGKKKRHTGRWLLAGLVGAGLLALSEGLRKKVLDALFGAEEEFEYTATTTPEPASSEPVGTAWRARTRKCFEGRLRAPLVYSASSCAVCLTDARPNGRVAGEGGWPAS